MTTYIEKHNIDKFTRRLLELDSIMQSSTKLWYLLFKSSWLMIYTMVESTTALKKLRSVAMNCHHSHEKCKIEECAKDFLLNASIIRDGFFDIHEETKKIKFLSFISPLIQKIVIDWDDFVVDLTISRDSELNQDISLLSDAI